jgi:hypothetical protein
VINILRSDIVSEYLDTYDYEELVNFFPCTFILDGEYYKVEDNWGTDSNRMYIYNYELFEENRNEIMDCLKENRGISLYQTEYSAYLDIELSGEYKVFEVDKDVYELFLCEE